MKSEKINHQLLASVYKRRNRRRKRKKIKKGKRKKITAQVNSGVIRRFFLRHLWPATLIQRYKIIRVFCWEMWRRWSNDTRWWCWEGREGERRMRRKKKKEKRDRSEDKVGRWTCEKWWDDVEDEEDTEKKDEEGIGWGEGWGGGRRELGEKIAVKTSRGDRGGDKARRRGTDEGRDCLGWEKTEERYYSRKKKAREWVIVI